MTNVCKHRLPNRTNRKGNSFKANGRDHIDGSAILTSKVVQIQSLPTNNMENTQRERSETVKVTWMTRVANEFCLNLQELVFLIRQLVH